MMHSHQRMITATLENQRTTPVLSTSCHSLSLLLHVHETTVQAVQQTTQQSEGARIAASARHTQTHTARKATTTPGLPPPRPSAASIRAAPTPSHAVAVTSMPTHAGHCNMDTRNTRATATWMPTPHTCGLPYKAWHVLRLTCPLSASAVETACPRTPAAWVWRGPRAAATRVPVRVPPCAQERVLVQVRVRVRVQLHEELQPAPAQLCVSRPHERLERHAPAHSQQQLIRSRNFGITKTVMIPNINKARTTAIPITSVLNII